MGESDRASQIDAAAYFYAKQSLRVCEGSQRNWPVVDQPETGVDVMKKPLKVTKGLAGLFYVRDADGAVVAANIPQESAELIASAVNNPTSPAELLSLLEECRAVFDNLFGHCCSNGVFNAWGKSFDCTKLNGVKYKVENTLKAQTKEGL